MLSIGQVWQSLGRIDKKSLPFGLRMTYQYNNDGIGISFILPVKDRTNRSLNIEVMRSIQIHHFYEMSDIPNEEELYWKIFGAIMSLTEHEIRESIVVDGVLVFDPHKKENHA